MGKHRRTRREKNIKKDDITGEWIVYKTFKKTGYHEYGRFKTFREAKKQRSYLDKNNNWINELPESKKVNIKRRGKGYQKLGNTYLVSKTVNNITSYYGQYKSTEDAEAVVYALVKNNYNWDKLPAEIKQLQLTKNANPTYFPNHRFKLIKYINKKPINLGYYANRKDAIRVREWLNNNTDNLEKLPDELKKLQVKLNEPKFYSYNKNKNKYHVHKNHDGKLHTYGVFDTEEEAKYLVKLLKEHNWDKEELIRLKIIPPEKEPKYYAFNKVNGRWYIHKTINGKKEFFGSYLTEKKAKQVVELLKKNNWDKNCLNGIKWGPKYYSYNKLTHKYTVSKIINGKQENFGSYNNQMEAQEIVDLLKEHNWDKSILKKLNILKDKPEAKYYSFNKRTREYHIQRCIKGKMYNFGNFPTEQEAINAVKLLKQNNWNKECLA